MTAKRRHRSSAEYLKYLKGELSGEERHSLERELERDPFQQEAMEGLEQAGHDEAEEDLLFLHASLRKRINRRKRVAWYSIAATVVSILIVGTVFLNIYQVNPKARQEPASEEESILRTTVPEPEKAESEDADVAEEGFPEDLDIDKEVPEEERTYELEEKAAPLPAEPPVREAGAKAAVPEDDAAVAKAAVPEDEAAVAEAAVPEDDAAVVKDDAALAKADAVVEKADAVVAVEAAPQGRKGANLAEPATDLAREEEEGARKKEERNQKMAREAVPQVMEYRAMDEELASDQLTGMVSGVVVSAEDMNPLPGATIYMEGADSGLVTDRQGRFTFPGNDKAQTTVTASYVGMVTGEYQLASGQENRLVMQPDQTALNEVVLVASESAVYQGAEPSGGIGAYKMYMEKNIRFPAGDDFGKREVVVLSFTVARDGTISGIQTLRSPGQAFTDEAIRLLKEGPAWNPARDENGPTDDEVRMRIVFRK